MKAAVWCQYKPCGSCFSVDAASLLRLFRVRGFLPSLKSQHPPPPSCSEVLVSVHPPPLAHALFFLPVVTKDGVYVLDMAAKIDATADYICKAKWGDVEFPPPFGREAYPEVRRQGSYPELKVLAELRDDIFT